MGLGKGVLDIKGKTTGGDGYNALRQFATFGLWGRLSNSLIIVLIHIHSLCSGR